MTPFPEKGSRLREARNQSRRPPAVFVRGIYDTYLRGGYVRCRRETAADEETDGKYLIPTYLPYSNNYV